MTEDTLENIIAEASEDLGIALSARQASRSALFLRILARWNRKISLTSVSDQRELVRHHLFEGFLAEKLLPFPVAGIADIGSGAGFPGIPMHILNPSRPTILLEKSLKKATFLSAALRELALPGRVMNSFSEEADIWKQTEMATVRALRLSEQTLSLLRDAGISLLVLEGKESQLSGKPWDAIMEKRIPLTENRWIRIFRPRCFT